MAVKVLLQCFDASWVSASTFSFESIHCKIRYNISKKELDAHFLQPLIFVCGLPR